FGCKARVHEKESDALLLLRINWKDIAKRLKTEIDSILRGPPDSIKLDNKSASEFVVQAIQLQKLITEYCHGAMKDLITPLRDQHDNNMLHLIGMIVNTKGLEDVSITALHMQRELLWFKEVESMIPPSYRKRRNLDGLTPHELFRNEHKDMVTQSERWMKEIASQCIVVGATFTVPDGYDENGLDAWAIAEALSQSLVVLLEVLDGGGGLLLEYIDWSKIDVVGVVEDVGKVEGVGDVGGGDKLN
nr:ankyrin repeat-containing domain, PGG domain protein [Tanacetum cinerariifolium]